MKSINFYIENPRQYIDELVKVSMDNSGANHALFALESHLHTQICDRDEFNMLPEDDKIHWYTVVTINSAKHCLELFKHPDFTALSFHDIHVNFINRLVIIYKRNHTINSSVEFYKIIEQLIIDLIDALNDVVNDIYTSLGKTIFLNVSMLILLFPSTISHFIKVMKFEHYPLMLPDIINFMRSDDEAMRALDRSIKRYKLTNGKSDVANRMLELYSKNIETLDDV